MLKKLLFLACSYSFIPIYSYSCDVADLTITSINTSGGNAVVEVTLCMGAGNLPGGGNPGAIGPTLTFGFGFYASDPTWALNSFAPLTVTSDSMGTTNTGYLQGPGNLGTQEFLLYVDPGNFFTCQYDAIPCGLTHQECYTFTFDMNSLPDSIRAFAIEGSSNPTGGCYPNADMAVNFTSLPVNWGAMSAKVEKGKVNVEWTTLNELNNDYFEVQRAVDGQAFRPIGVVNGMGNSEVSNQYDYIDENPLPGKNYYRLLQVDQDGHRRYSKVIETWYDSDILREVNVGPNPVKEELQVVFTLGESSNVRFQIVDLQGKIVQQFDRQLSEGRQKVRYPIQGLAEGMYLLKLKVGGRQYVERIVR